MVKISGGKNFIKTFFSDAFAVYRAIGNANDIVSAAKSNNGESAVMPTMQYTFTPLLFSEPKKMFSNPRESALKYFKSREGKDAKHTIFGKTFYVETLPRLMLNDNEVTTVPVTDVYVIRDEDKSVMFFAECLDSSDALDVISALCGVSAYKPKQRQHDAAYEKTNEELQNEEAEYAETHFNTDREAI